MFKADLHCHSTYSDGSLTPFELLDVAKKRGLVGLSITDHDTIDAYTPEFFAYAQRIEMEIIPGVEISSRYKDTNVHILGYGFDINCSSLQDLLRENRKKRIDRNRAILEKLAQKNMKISEKELFDFAKRRKNFASTAIGRPHIAHLMCEKGFVSSFQQAFDLYLKDGGSCYVIGEKISPLEGIEKLHIAQGKAIIAHPHLIKREKVLKELLDMPFDGIEVGCLTITPFQKKKLEKIAEKRGWIVTGGSDFHGQEKSFFQLGSKWVSRDIFQKLKMK